MLDAELYRAGSEAAAYLLDALYGVRIAKALDPLDPGDFVTICVRLSSALRGATGKAEGEALREAIEGLDVDWPTLSSAGRDKVIEAARQQVASMADEAGPAAEQVLGRAADRIIPATRTRTIGAFALDIPEGLSDRDKETGALLRDSQMVYIKDQYGRRADAFDTLAKQVVSSGLERGLGRDDISGELAARLADNQIQRSVNYWNLIATDFSNKARTSTQLFAFGEAGIVRYQFDSILDEATSEICRLLHGRTFSVKKAAERTGKALALTDPEDIKNVRPWVQAGKDAAGNDILYFDKHGERQRVAVVHEGAEGSKDKIGTYGGVLSNKQLEAAGVTVPPCHGHCRSTIKTVD